MNPALDKNCTLSTRHDLLWTIHERFCTAAGDIAFLVEQLNVVMSPVIEGDIDKSGSRSTKFIGSNVVAISLGAGCTFHVHGHACQGLARIDGGAVLQQMKIIIDRIDKQGVQPDDILRASLPRIIRLENEIVVSAHCGIL
jgi:hypothetical protein